MMTRSDLIVADGRCTALDAYLAQARVALSLSQGDKAERYRQLAREAALEIAALLEADTPDTAPRERSFFPLAREIANDCAPARRAA